jgi:hypothetical protein
MQEPLSDAMVCCKKGKTEGTHFWVTLQSIRLIHRQSCESLYSFLLVIFDPAEECLPDAGVSQNRLDLVRLAVNVTSKFGEGRCVWLPEATTFQSQRMPMRG